MRPTGAAGLTSFSGLEMHDACYHPSCCCSAPGSRSAPDRVHRVPVRVLARPSRPRFLNSNKKCLSFFLMLSTKQSVIRSKAIIMVKCGQAQLPPTGVCWPSGFHCENCICYTSVSEALEKNEILCEFMYYSDGYIWLDI